MFWLVEITVAQPNGAMEGRREALTAAYADLRKLAGVIDPEMSATVADGRVKFSFILEDDDRASAADRASCAVRSALHGAGGSTPGWDLDLDEALSRSRVASEPVPV